MLKNKFLIGILSGILISIALFVWVKNPFSENKKEETNHYFILNNQISKMNKMVVVEQDFSFIQKNNSSYSFLGKEMMEAKVMTLTKTNAQVSYDLTKMKVKIDSVQRKLIIEELPEPQVKITPQVDIESIDDSFLNRIKDTDLKKITEQAKATAIGRVNQEQLKVEGRKQLFVNLEQIFVLAKALDYQIVDNTQTIPIELM